MRQTVLFTTRNETIQVKQIIFAGAIYEIDPKKRKNENTHAFKIITRADAIWCFFKDLDSAKKIRGALAIMMDQVKGNLFKTHGEALDPKSVVSFSRVNALKSNFNNATHGFVVTVETLQEKNSKIWFTYSSEEHAEQARKGLYASLMESNGVEKTISSIQEPEQVLAA